MIALIFAFFAIIFVELVAYFEPYAFPLHLAQGEARKIADNVIIGPYSQRKDLERLKRYSGVVEVISLLDPDLPIERQLLERERDEAKILGLKFSNYPMNIFNLNSYSNERTADKIADYAARNFGPRSKGKLYINCYLGKHRVKLVEKALRKRSLSKSAP